MRTEGNDGGMGFAMLKVLIRTAIPSRERDPLASMCR
jgi:hypothetical protein